MNEQYLRQLIAVYEQKIKQEPSNQSAQEMLVALKNKLAVLKGV